MALAVLWIEVSQEGDIGRRQERAGSLGCDHGLEHGPHLVGIRLLGHHPFQVAGQQALCAAQRLVAGQPKDAVTAGLQVTIERIADDLHVCRLDRVVAAQV